MIQFWLLRVYTTFNGINEMVATYFSDHMLLISSKMTDFYFYFPHLRIYWKSIVRTELSILQFKPEALHPNLTHQCDGWFNENKAIFSPVSSCVGNAGAVRKAKSNYFEVLKRPDWHLLQYRVDFTPDIDHTGVRKAMLKQLEAKIGKYIFDGTLLYCTKRLPEVSS